MNMQSIRPELSPVDSTSRPPLLLVSWRRTMSLEPMICEDGIVKVKRWIWSDDWRTFFPLYCTVSGEGIHWTCPTAKQVKMELLWQISALGKEFGRGEKGLSYLTLYVAKMKKETFVINEQPEIAFEATDDWLVNDRTALMLSVNYSDEPRARCDPSINVDDMDEDSKKAREQQALMEVYEHENYPSSVSSLVKGSGGPDSIEQGTNTTSKEEKQGKDGPDAKKGKKSAQQEAYDQAVAAAFKAGLEAGRKGPSGGPSEASRGSAVTSKSWEDVSPKP